MSRELSTTRSSRVGPAAVAGEIVTVLAPGEARLPRRTRGQAADRVTQLTALLIDLAVEGSAIDALAFRKSLEARVPASVKALANDLACYRSFCDRARGPGLPASEARLVAYLEDCEARSIIAPSSSRTTGIGSSIIKTVKRAMAGEYSRAPKPPRQQALQH